jgi:hypothetical protein
LPPDLTAVEGSLHRIILWHTAEDLSGEVVNRALWVIGMLREEGCCGVAVLLENMLLVVQRTRVHRLSWSFGATGTSWARWDAVRAGGRGHLEGRKIE